MDIVTFGEAMVRLTPPGFGRLETARQLEVQVGGAELNTAVALARLGHTVQWVSRLGDNPLGRLIAQRAREAGVQTDYVEWNNDDRVGLFFVESGAHPRPSTVTYDRQHTAASKIRPGMFSWDAILTNAKWFHVTGITPALGPSVAAATREALDDARKSGLSTSLDVNYRSKLWSVSEAGRSLRELLPLVDMLIASPGDAKQLFDIRGPEPEQVARKLSDQFEIPTVAMTLREDSSAWRNGLSGLVWHKGKLYESKRYEVEIVDRIGAGDAFAAGLIHGLLDNDGQLAVDWGTAMAALQHTIPGDFAWVTPDEVAAAIRGGGQRIAR